MPGRRRLLITALGLVVGLLAGGTASACHGFLTTTPPGQVPNYNHGEDFGFRVYLEADGAATGPHLSTNPAAAATDAYTHGDAAAGLAAAAGSAAGAKPAPIVFSLRNPLDKPLWFNLSKPIVGIFWFSSATLQTASPRDHSYFRVELFVNEQRLGGEDCYTIASTTANAWTPGTMKFRPEAAKLMPGDVLHVKITRFGSLSDFRVGTGGDQQSFFELRVTSYDLVKTAISLERNKLRFGVPEEAPAGGESGTLSGGGDAGSVPFGLATLALPFALASFPRRKAARTALLVALAFGAVALGGCLSGSAKSDAVPEDPNVPTPTVEQESKERDDLKEKGVGAIRGIVRNDLGLPLAGAHIVLIGTSHFGSTDTKGVFGFPSVEAGTFKLRVDKDRYQALERPVTVEVGRELYLNITVVPKIPQSGNQREHLHDVWGDATSMELFKGQVTPASYQASAQLQPTNNYACVYFYACLTDVPIDDGKPVLPGTGLVEVSLNWNPELLNINEIGLVVTTPKGSYRYMDLWYYPATDLVPRGPREPFRIPIFPDEADAGHQAFTTWSFKLVLANTKSLYVPYQEAVSAGGRVEATITIHKGHIVPEPPHKTFWGNETERVILQESKKSLACAGTCSYPNPSTAYMWYYNDWKVLIPPGTKQIVGKLTWSNTNLGENPAQNDWTIAYSGGDSPYVLSRLPDDLTRVRESKRGDAFVEFVIDVDPVEVDQFYQSTSNWDFYPDDQVDNLAGTAYSVNTGYQTSLYLSLTLVKDPDHKGD
ncbi:MAG: carboxypeptidase regulatory-like domain-containing protein [Euryarchaeota archaeon]|nr:carboxypeptidase regulatory-like domain-containing protein [Euryarchaeota archaeon]